MLNSERKQKKHRHLWLTRDDVTRGTTLFQSPYNSALFYVYSICYTNIQLNALTFDKCFSSEDSHTEISKRFAWNALSRWHFISASLHLLYLHMFIVQNQKYYCIILRLCQRSHLSISECYDFNSPIFLLLCVAFLLFPYFTTSTQKEVQSTVSQMIDVISSILRASLNLEVRCLIRSSGEFARTDFNR